MSQQSTTLARPEDRLARLPGTYRDAQAITQRLQFAADGRNCHLVSPSTAIGTLPEGFAVSVTTVQVDVEKETYPIAGGGGGDDDGKGKRGLSKVALDKIAAAAGISWVESRRLDDRSCPNYCEWEAIGQVRTLDGSWLQLRAQKTMDLRDGSPAVDALYARYEAKRRRYPNAKSPDGQIRELRLHIQAHAETKARLRAIRALGIRTSYDAAELSKPFVIARSTWTGQSSDPELARQFAMMTAERALSAGRALYGESYTQPPALSPPPAAARLAPRASPPPPVGTVNEPIDDEEDELAPRDVKPANTTPEAPATPPANEPPPAA